MHSRMQHPAPATRDAGDRAVATVMLLMQCIRQVLRPLPLPLKLAMLEMMGLCAVVAAQWLGLRTVLCSCRR